jgi:hypothetical protein
MRRIRSGFCAPAGPSNRGTDQQRDELAPS